MENLYNFYSSPIPIKVNYHNSPYKLELTDKGDWCDLYTAEDVHINAGERQYISLGISMQLPREYEAIVAPRSSTFKNWGILQTNSIGVIDSGYRNSIGVIYDNISDSDYTIHAGDRIAQLIVAPAYHFKPQMVLF